MGSLRVIRLLAAATTVLATTLMLAACGAGSTSSKPPAHQARPAASTATSLAGLPAAQILSKALAAAQAAGSVHFAGTNKSSTGTSNYSQNAAPDLGTQVITTSSGGRVNIRMVAGVGYLRGNVTALSQIFPGKAVSQFAGRWIATRPGDPGYTDVTVGVTLASALAEFTPDQPLTKTGPMTLDGQSVIGVKGVASASGSVPKGQPVTLYVMAAGRPLPVSFQGGNGADQSTISFSQWGETVHTAAPANPVPISSVMSS
jgi:hypothetical protein